MADDSLARELPIINRKGLHARASAKFVQTVERYDAEVTVTRNGETVGGRSIMGLLTLGRRAGHDDPRDGRRAAGERGARRHRGAARQPLRRGRVGLRRRVIRPRALPLLACPLP
jgi:phosphotransferase system HPr (HPr) family protein